MGMLLVTLDSSRRREGVWSPGKVLTYSFQTFRAQPTIVVALYVEAFPTRLMFLLVVPGLPMFADKQKRFERFMCLSLPRFSGAIGEDAYEFLVDF